MSAPIADMEDLFRPYGLNPRLKATTTATNGGTTTMRPTAETKALRKQFQRNLKPNMIRQELRHDFDLRIDQTHYETEDQAVVEATRCLKCADAPCQKACPVTIDVKAFITCIQSRNFYGAAQMILHSNPVGYTCGTLCMTSELCGSACNLSPTHAGAINISGLQEFAMARYAQMHVQPKIVLRNEEEEEGETEETKDEGETNTEETMSTSTRAILKKKHKKKIALIGAGPSTISCATYLQRLGLYRQIDIYEKHAHTAGGLPALEIPAFRLPTEAVAWELNQLQHAKIVSASDGDDESKISNNNNYNNKIVHVKYNQQLGRDFTLQSLLQGRDGDDAYDAVFVGVGKMAPKTIPALAALTPAQGYYDSKQFLTAVAEASKPFLGGGNGASATTPLLTLSGRVLVLGGGDVATDCARAAFRMGADRVTLCLRRNITQFRATQEEVSMTLEEQVDVLPYALPKQVILHEGGDDDKNDKAGRIRALELYKTEQGPDGSYDIDDGQFIRVKCDYVISAFGCQAHPEISQALAPVVTLNKWGEIDVNEFGQTKNDPRVFAGGDIIGSDTQVAAANDGKVAAWGMHHFLQNRGMPTSMDGLPLYTTEIDDVDISVEVCGVKFPNPFGLASAPPATSCEMIARAFAQGWGFAVTKTFTNEADLITNVSPRIFSSLQGSAKDRHYQEGFINIELISEKTAEYWCDGIRELKRRFPDRVVVASIMSTYEKHSWQSLTRMSCEAGADMIEMNLSCPHGMHEKGMGLALGVYPDKVKQVCSWVSEASTVPVFAKLTPNVTDITVIAQAAHEGGVDGLTAINTVSGLTGFHTDATPGRHGVGSHKNMAYGGLCGNNIRPLALRGVSAIGQKLPGIPIMATGGIDSADVAVQMMYAGASVVQICSAVMNQDFTIIHDLISGLKSILYMRGRNDLQDWNHGAPPKDQQSLKPRKKFGPLEMQRRQEAIEKRVKLVVKPLDHFEETKEEPQPLMVSDLVGMGLEHIKTYNELNNQEQVVAYVDPDMCLNCGKCYSTCNDNGYQAITFDPVTHLPMVNEEKCTGCGLCESVCPAVNCISFHPRDGFLAPVRYKKDL